MKARKYLLLGGLLLVAPWASADLSYTNATLGYVVDGDIDGSSVDVDGLQLSGKFAFNENFFVLGNFERLETDPGNTDLDRFDIGAGYHTPLNDIVDIVGSIAYTDVEVGSFDGDGFTITGGLRAMPSSVVEVSADLVYEDIDIDGVSDDSDTGFQVEGRYFFSNTLSGGLKYRDVRDLETLAINVRFDF